MGYDLRILREGGIPLGEWLALVESDPELRPEPGQGPGFARWSGPSGLPEPWLDWAEGEVHSKNPDAPLRRKMVALADRLRARVEGDDGEVYGPDGEAAPAATVRPSPPPAPRLPAWLARFLGGRHSAAPDAPPPFRPGDRVRCPLRGEGVVVACDPKAEHGLGRVTVRFADGTLHDRAVVASGLEPLPPA